MAQSGGCSKAQRKQQGCTSAAASVRPLRPTIERRMSFSSLTKREMKKRITGREPVDLDLMKPENSAWLNNILRELQDCDMETRYYALCRFESVLQGIVLKGPAVHAGFASYMLEQGILDEIIRLLNVAQSEGDIYLVAGGVESREEALRITEEGLYVQSKVGTCFRILNALIADARTARFVRKSIPELLSILEGSYLSDTPVVIVGGQGIRGTHVYQPLRDEEKTSALDALATFTLWSADEVRNVISSRRQLLHQILDDCLAGNDFSRTIVGRSLTTISVLASVSSALPVPVDDFVQVAMKALEMCEKPEVIKLVVSLLFFHVKEKPAFLENKTTAYLSPLLALAACPTLEQEVKSHVYKLLCLFDQQTFDPIFAKGDPKRDLEKLARESPAAAARRVKLCRAFAFNQQPAFKPKQSSTLEVGPDLPAQERDYVVLVTPEEFQAQKRPPRKCSRTDCSKKESTSCEFKLCGNCRLAVYCSQGKTFQY